MKMFRVSKNGFTFWKDIADSIDYPECSILFNGKTQIFDMERRIFINVGIKKFNAYLNKYIYE